MMQAIAEIFGKKIQVEWSAAADKAMTALASPLLVEMELYFSCMVRKTVRFNRDPELEDYVTLTPHFKLRFRPVMTRVCSVSEVEDEPPLDDMQLVKPAAFVPKTLFIDFKRGQWLGEFHMSEKI